VKKKKKKNGREECQYKSIDFSLDVSLGSQVNNVTDGSSTQQYWKRSSDVEHLERNTEAKLNGTKCKKEEEIILSISILTSSCSAQMQGTNTWEEDEEKKILIALQM